MIPIEVENRIANYFFHRYLPEELMMKIVDGLLNQCLEVEEEEIGVEELVMWAIDIIDLELDSK